MSEEYALSSLSPHNESNNENEETEPQMTLNSTANNENESNTSETVIDTNMRDTETKENETKTNTNTPHSNPAISTQNTEQILENAWNENETKMNQNNTENRHEMTETQNDSEIINEKPKEKKEKNKSVHVFSMDMASLIQVLDDAPNNELCDTDSDTDSDTDTDTAEESKGSDSGDSSYESDIDKMFDLADSEQLQQMQMMTVRNELKNAKNEHTKKLWKTKSIAGRKNVFLKSKAQTRNPFHNALVDAVSTEMTEITVPKRNNNFDLGLKTEDFTDVDPIIEETQTHTSDGTSLNDKIERVKAQMSAVTEESNMESESESGDSDEFTLRRRIWCIVRLFVTVYLYISNSFEFAYFFNKNERNLHYLILNWLCDAFMAANAWIEYLHFRDDVMDSATKKVIADLNEAESKLDAMRNMNAKSYRNKVSKADMRDAIKDFGHGSEHKSESDAYESEKQCLNKFVLQWFGRTKYESIKLYRLSHFVCFDFVTLFPFDIIALMALSQNSQNWKWFIVCRLLKLFHIFRLFEYFEVSFVDWIPDRGVMRSAFVSRLAKIIVIGIGWLHLWSCVWFFLGSNLFVQDSDYKSTKATDTWLTAYYHRLEGETSLGDSEYSEYLWSIYFVTVTFSTVGYGDIVPMNRFEIVLIILFQLINFVFITVFVAELAPVIEEFFFRHLQRGAQHRRLRNCFESIDLSIGDRDRLREANRYWWRNQYGMEERAILNELPRSLSMEVKYQFLERSLLGFIAHIIAESVANIRENTEKSKIDKLASLKAEDLIPHGLLRKMANECEPKSYIRDQVILSQNVENSALYLLIDGKVRKRDEDDSLEEFKPISNYPNFFGHESFWKSKTKSQYTYTADSAMVCVFVLGSKQIRNVLRPYPEISELFATIFKKAYPAFHTQNDADTLRRKPALQLQILSENEIRQQDWRYSFYRYTSLLWDVFNGFAIMFQCYTFIWGISFFLMPRISFEKQPYKGPLIMNWAIDALFIADILLCAYPNLTKMVYFYPSRSKTQKQLQKRAFAYDILISLPFELILLPTLAWNTTFIYLLRALKWLRIAYIPYSWQSWVELLRSLHIASKFTRMLFIAFAILHCFACLWYLIGTFSFVENESLNWIVNDAIISDTDDGSFSIARSWLRSLCFAIITETTIGYGGIVPFSLPEIVYDVLLLFVGSILYWISISFFAISASYQQFSVTDHTNLVTATEFLLTKQLSLSALEKNDALMVRLQHYFDFVLQEREGAVSFWDEQKPSLQTLLRYQLLSTACNTKKSGDPQKYRFLEWIADEIMFEFSKHLQWIVICKGQQIRVKQSGTDSFVLFLITGTLWSPYSNYIFSRHAQSDDHSEIVTFNLNCLAPINLNISHNSEGIDAMQMLSTYLQIDIDPNKYPKLHQRIYGVFEICDAHNIGLRSGDSDAFQVIYQKIPPELKESESEESKNTFEEQPLMDGTFAFLVYTDSEHMTSVGLGTIDESESIHSKSESNGRWTFLTMQRSEGKLDLDSKKEIAFCELFMDEKSSVDPKLFTNTNEWKTFPTLAAVTIPISDELHFEALETCDVVSLYQKDVIESFKEYYPVRYSKYLHKSIKTNNPSILIRRGSILSPTNQRKSHKKTADNLAKLIMSDSKFAFDKHLKKMNISTKRRRSSNRLPQFKDGNGLLSTQSSLRQTQNEMDLSRLRQETTLFVDNDRNRASTEHLHFREAIKRYSTLLNQDSENENKNEKHSWAERAKSIAFEDGKYRILKIIWYFVAILFIALLQFILPMRAVFRSEESFVYFGFDIVTQIYFFIDILLSVQWKDKRDYEKDRLLKVLDYVLVIPWPFVGLILSWKVYYFFRLFGLLRLTRIKHYWNDLRRELVYYTGRIISVHAGLSAIVFHIFILFLTASYCACLWYIIGISESKVSDSWINKADKDTNIYYTLSVYWAMASMSSVGYGDLKPNTLTETVFAIFALPCMVGFYIRFMGDMASFAGNIERSTKTAFYQKFSHTLLALNRRIEHLKLFSSREAQNLVDLKKKIRVYLLALWKERAGICESEVYDKLPYFLTRDISFQCRKKYLGSIPCIAKYICGSDHTQLMKTIAFKFEHHIITRNEELPLDQIFVLEKGDLICVDSQSQQQLNLSDLLGNHEMENINGTDNDVQPRLESAKNTENIVQKLLKEINPRKLTSHINLSMHGMDSAGKNKQKFEVYLPPQPSNKSKEHKLKCISKSASLYSLPFEALIEIQMNYESDSVNYEIIQDICDHYWSHSSDSSNDEMGSFDYKSAAHTMKMVTGAEAEDYTKSKYLLQGEVDNKSEYYLLFYPKRKILHRTHKTRLFLDLCLCLGLYAYVLILPLQFTNVFYTHSAVRNGLLLSFAIDAYFVAHFVLRLLVFASHPIKKLNPFYAMMGTYDNARLKRAYFQKLSAVTNGETHLIYRDLPMKKSDVRPLSALVLEIMAMLPLNVCGSFVSNNVYLRLNKILYIFVLFRYCNATVNTFIYKYKIYFITARIFRICAGMIAVLHIMACVWLSLAEFEDSTNKTWLTEMEPKKQNILHWSDSPFYAYLLSLYFVVITMTTTGYGDITPVSQAEINVTNALIIAGDTLMALMAGVFIQYISHINQPSLEIVIKERSITHYLQHRSSQILRRSAERFEASVLKKQKKQFKKLNRQIFRYFQMQLDYQSKVSTIPSLTQHLPLYYRMKLLHTLFESKFKPYKFLYSNKDLYFRILDSVREEIYTYWGEDHSFEFIIDPQQNKIIDFMLVQFGQCCVYSSKQWFENERSHFKLKKEGDLIGFRSLVLQNSRNKSEKVRKKLQRKEKPKCVITPMPNEQKYEKFKIVSILKITAESWTQIMNDVFLTHEAQMEFEEWVANNIKPDI